MYLILRRVDLPQTAASESPPPPRLALDPPTDTPPPGSTGVYVSTRRLIPTILNPLPYASTRRPLRQYA
eukprot:2457614-Rhodomonas_salina.1